MSNRTSLESLRNGLTAMQRRLLITIWSYYLKNNKWMRTRALHRDFGKETVLSALNELGGTICYEVLDSGKYRYTLTFLGVLLTDQFQEAEGLLARCLEYMKQRYLDDAEVDSVKSQEVQAVLGLNAEQCRLLGRLIYLSPFSGGGGFGESEWHVTIPNEVDAFPSIKDFREYIRERAMELFNPAVPVGDRERMEYLSREVNPAMPDWLSRVDMPRKEVEQKFKILYSPAQAAIDFEAWCNELRPNGSPIAVLFVDIDHFKALNTRHTETKIDQTVLPEAQRLLAALVRLRGCAYRQGGDEFVVILPNHSSAEGLAFGERVRSVYEQHPFKADEESEKLTVSVGIAIWPEHGATFEEVLLKANEAKRLAKAFRNIAKLAEQSVNQQNPLPGSGLSLDAQRLAVFLNERSKLGIGFDPDMEAKEVMEALKLAEDQVGIAADELKEKEWVELQSTNADGKAGFTYISTTPKLFLETDPVLKKWDPKADAKVLAKAIVDTGEDRVFLSVVAATLSWEPRRVNPAADYLAGNEIVHHTRTTGSAPYTFECAFITPKTRRFAAQD